jgi:hypothetical protein
VLGTIAEVLAAVDAGQVDLATLDGEAEPTGGFGLAHQLEDEIEDCPPTIVIIRRRDDRWLASSSRPRPS